MRDGRTDVRRLAIELVTRGNCWSPRTRRKSVRVPCGFVIRPRVCCGTNHHAWECLEAMASQPRSPTGAGVSTCATVHAPPLPRSPFLSFAQRLSGSPVALSAIVVLIAFLVTAFAASAAGDDLPGWFPAALAGKSARMAGIIAAALLLCVVLVDMGVRSFAGTRAEGRFLVRSGSLSPIPGPVPQLPLGNVEAWEGDGDILGAMVKMAKRFGPVFTVWFGSTPCVVVAERDMVNAIVKANHKDYDKGLPLLLCSRVSP